VKIFVWTETGGYGMSALVMLAETEEQARSVFWLEKKVLQMQSDAADALVPKFHEWRNAYWAKHKGNVEFDDKVRSYHREPEKLVPPPTWEMWEQETEEGQAWAAMPHPDVPHEIPDRPADDVVDVEQWPCLVGYYTYYE